METAIFAVIILLGIGAATWYLRSEIVRLFAANRDSFTDVLSGFDEDFDVAHREIAAIRKVLTEAGQINAGKPRQPSSVFDGDKIQEKPAPQRYVPIARRRAMAEQSSMGPQNHAESVREANARAIESAG